MFRKVQRVAYPALTAPVFLLTGCPLNSPNGNALPPSVDGVQKRTTGTPHVFD